MVEFTERDLDAIHDTHDKVIRMDAILGNGDSGLCRDVREHQKRISRIELVIVGVVSTGGLTGGIIGLVKWLG